jgi:hypothetical protein
VPCPLWAIEATSRRCNKLRIALVERREFKDEKNVRLNPEVKAPHWKQDALRFLPARAPILFEASRESLFLLGWLELRQQERMADADLLAVERIYDCLRKFDQTQPRGHIHRTLARLRGNLFDAVLRLLQFEEGAEAVSFFHRMYVTTLEVFNLSLVLQELFMMFTTMDS